MLSRRNSFDRSLFVTILLFSHSFSSHAFRCRSHITIFADHRAWLGIPNFGDVSSNLAFAIFGLHGIVIPSPREFCELVQRCARTHPVVFSFFLGSF